VWDGGVSRPQKTGRMLPVDRDPRTLEWNMTGRKVPESGSKRRNIGIRTVDKISRSGDIADTDNVSSCRTSVSKKYSNYLSYLISYLNIIK
jgi:hypothetical protein